MAAAQAVPSATQRRAPIRRGAASPAAVIWAADVGGPGRRCRTAAITGGPARAAARTSAASDHPSTEEAALLSTAKARPAPSSAAGSTTTAVPRSRWADSWAIELPRARSRASSAPRRTATIRAATAMTAAPATIRLTNSRASAVSTSAWVVRNAARLLVSGDETETTPAPPLSGPRAGNVCAT